MQCYRCNAKIKKEKYCPNCGADLQNQQPIKDFKKIEETQNLNEKNENKELLDIFIGPNSGSIKNKKFSFLAFIFGSGYFFVRKLYKWGILFLLIEWIIRECHFWYLMFFMRICLGLYFNAIYLEEANKRIEEIKREYPKTNPYGLKEIARTRGGLNWWLLIIVFIVYFTVLTIFFIIMFGLDKDRFIDESNSIKNVELKYELPEEFIEFTITKYSKLYYTNDKKCSFKIQKNILKGNGNEDIKEINNKFLSSNYEDKFIEINDYLWSESLSYDEDNNIKTYSLKSLYENTSYEIEFEILKDIEHEYCENSYEKFKKSLEINY